MDYLEVVEILKKGEGLTIGAEARMGDKKALAVVNAYKMILSLNEPCAQVLFVSAYEDYKKSRSEKVVAV